MADPKSIDEWLALVERHRISALALLRTKGAAAEAHHHAGFACEAALKAYIFHVERPNDWDQCAKTLMTHDLYKLARRAGLLDPYSDIAASLMTVVQWNRAQGYDPSPMPLKVAKSMFSASFSEKGVVTWIRQKMKPGS